MEHVLRGSLIERYLRCGKPGCKCAQGEGHGPKFYLSVSFAGHRPQMDYVRQGDYERVSQCLSNPDGHFKFPHLWPLKLPQAGRSDYGFPDPV
jgi:hypothetical protein